MTIHRTNGRLAWALAPLLVVAACGGFKDQGDRDAGATGDGGNGGGGDASWPEGGAGHDGSAGSDGSGGGSGDAAGTGGDATSGNEAGSTGNEGGSNGDGGSTGNEGGSNGDGGSPGNEAGSGSEGGSTGSEAGSAGDGSLSCTTGGNPDRRFPQWRLPPAVPSSSNYVISGGTVLDLTTGLLWEHQPPPQGLDWAGVNARCTALGTGGFDDWRVPTRAEILTILDYSQIEGQFLDSLIFGNTVPDNGNLVWTSSSIDVLNPATTGEFALDTFNSRTTVVSTDSASLALSMCVRSGCVATSATRFVTSTDAAQDTATGLTWQRATSASVLTLPGAQAYCAGLSAGGMSSGWRVPSVRELASTFDETQHAFPMWDPSTFSTSAGTELWSSTAVASDGGNTFTLSFSDDTIYGFILIEAPSDGTTLGVRCAHD